MALSPRNIELKVKNACHQHNILFCINSSKVFFSGLLKTGIAWSKVKKKKKVTAATFAYAMLGQENVYNKTY